MPDYVGELREKLLAASVNEWKSTPTGLAARMTVRNTPEEVSAQVWDKPTYFCLETLDFTFRSTGQEPVCLYRLQLAPWVPESEQEISYERGLELLAEPLVKSYIHSN